MNKVHFDLGGASPRRQNVGDTVRKKIRGVLPSLVVGLAAVGLLLLSGCGGGSSANVIAVNISSSAGDVLILGQSTTFTATVTGATNTNVNWQPCMYTTTTVSGSTTTTSKPVNCPTDGSFGTLSNQQASGTETYLAPSLIPDQTKFPGLILIFTAESQQNTTRTGSVSISLDSGISVTLNTTSATVPTEEKEQFFVTLTNDLQNKHVTWLITQNVPSTTGTTTTTFPQLPTCSPSCGTITQDTNNPNFAVYTAPSSVPTAISPAQNNNTNSPANVTFVATSVTDNTRFALGTITIVAGGPITFRGISPSFAPQGAALWDIFLDAPNITSASQITLTDSKGGSVVKPGGSGQVKILFDVPITTTTTTNGVTTTTVTNPNSTGARLRLSTSATPIPDLAVAGPYTISVTDPVETVTQCTGTPLPQGCSSAGNFTFTVTPTRATTTASVPDDIVQSAQAQLLPVTIDGGYFGPQGNSVAAYFQSPPTALTVGTSSDARHLSTQLDTTLISPGNPGLYPLFVRTNTTPAPLTNNPSVTNMAIFPDYSPSKGSITVTGPPVPAGTNPSAVDIDPTLGVLVVAETGSNSIEFFGIGNGTLTSKRIVTGTGTTPINVPTGLSVDRIHHTVAVVNYGSQTVTTNSDGSCKQATPTGQSVTVLNIPGSPVPITEFSVDLPFFVVPSGALQGSSVCPAPMPYSIGVDPDSRLALVAYSSTTISSSANLGFMVNLNPDSPSSPPNECVLDHAINPSSTKMGQCLFSQVTLNTGVYPQIAMSPRAHEALVTPGGSGVVRGVDVTKPSSANVILSSSLTAGIVTVTIDTTKCPPPLPNPNPNATPPTNPCPFSMVPGNAGSVFITGLTPGNSATSSFFNGVFSVNVTSSDSFTYAVNSTATDTAAAVSPVIATVFYGTPDQIFPISATTQGVAINPITDTAALADANATGTNGPQIDLLNGLDQSVSSITFFANCTAFSTSCPSTTELLATTNVAWQPFTNELVSYNPKQQFVSISDPVSRRRYAIANNLGPSAIALPVMNGTPPTSSPTLTLWGGVAVDPATNQAFVVESGQAANPTVTPPIPAKPGQIEIINLNAPNTAAPIKPTHISELIVPSTPPAPPVCPNGSVGGGVPNTLLPQATLTSTNNVCVQIFGSGFAGGSTQVHLDGVDLINLGGTINNIDPSGREIDVTIPASALSIPHHYAVDVASGGFQSNAADFIVIQSVSMTGLCKDSNGNVTDTHPSAVAIVDQVANIFSPFALVSNTGCNSISVIDINPANVGSTFGTRIGNPTQVGSAPQGIAVWQRKAVAVVANNGSGTASVLDLTKSPPVSLLTADVSTGTNPSGVAINEATGAALVANTGSNTVSMINLGLLFPAAGTAPPTTLTPVSIGGIQQPLAVAIDPDRGATNEGIAVVTAVQLNSGAGATGALAVVEIGLSTPSLSNTISSGTVTATPTGIVFDPIAPTTTTNQGVFYANSSGSNVITTFNPDGGGSSVPVGINPTSLALNPQTGAILTANSASNTISLVDTLSSPFKTRQTLGIPGSPTFGVAIDQFTNLAVIVDQANQRVLLFPMPH